MHSFYYNFKSNILKNLERTIAARESTLPLKVQMKSNIFRNVGADYCRIRFNTPIKKNSNLTYLEILERTIAAPESTLPLKVQFQNRHLQHLH